MFWHKPNQPLHVLRGLCETALWSCVVSQMLRVHYRALAQGGQYPRGGEGFYSPWTGNTGADKSDTSSLMFLTATTFEAFSFHPSPCCCCRGCHSALKNGDLPRKAAAAASAPCPCECLMQSDIGIASSHHKATYNHPFTTLITETSAAHSKALSVVGGWCRPLRMARDSQHRRRRCLIAKAISGF